MAIGARKAFEDNQSAQGKARWDHLLFTGCDGLPKTGQTWVRNKILKATVVVPANTGLAMELVLKARGTGVNPPEIAFTEVSSYPAIEALSVAKKK
jgi:hypothetical protein